MPMIALHPEQKAGDPAGSLKSRPLRLSATTAAARTAVCSIFAAGLALSSPSWANETAAKNTKVSLGTSYFSSNYDKPGSEYKVSGWIKTLTASHRLNESWTIGGLLSHTSAGGEIHLNSNKKDLTSWTPGAFVTWENQSGLNVTGAASYGRTSVDNKRLSSGVYRPWGTETHQVATSLDVTQYVPVTETLLANVGTRLTRVWRSEDPYQDPIGGRTGNRNKYYHYGTLQTGLTYFLGDFTPFASANVTFADENLIQSSDSRSFFGYALGSNYRLTNSVDINASYAAVEGIKYFRDRRYTLSLGYRF